MKKIEYRPRKSSLLPLLHRSRGDTYNYMQWRNYGFVLGGGGRIVYQINLVQGGRVGSPFGAMF